MQSVLEVNQLTMQFGGLKAIDNIVLDVKEKEIVALIGPNGAGKTTFLNCITGIYKPTGGEVQIHPPSQESKIINGLKTNQITTLGMARTFQNIRLFPNMTTLENVLVGRYCRTNANLIDIVFHTPKFRQEEKHSVEYCYHLLEEVGLAHEANNFEKNLPYAHNVA
jgi:branched-chain amino acid transport system ATP-binding protein